MVRRAFLIGAPFIKGKEGYLRGVTPDIVNMKNYLMSNRGGAWEEDEISTLRNPSTEELQSELAGEYDLVFIQYSGHGFEYRTTGTQLDIRPGESISLADVHGFFSAKWRVYFLDCCRGLPKIVEKSQTFAQKESLQKAVEYHQFYRDKYERTVAGCEKGYSIIYSCGLDETAAEDDAGLGGEFTLSYLNVAKSVPSLGETAYLGIQDIFRISIARLRKDYPMNGQTPTMKPERRNHYLPFVV